MDNEQRIGVVAIVVSDKNAVPQVQTVLSAHGTIIVGRMGIPDHESGKNVIALIVKGTVEQVSALSGALGRIDGASAKSLLTKGRINAYLGLSVVAKLTLCPPIYVQTVLCASRRLRAACNATKSFRQRGKCNRPERSLS